MASTVPDKIMFPDGWVLVAPDGLVLWNMATHFRSQCIDGAVRGHSSLLPPFSKEAVRAEWRRMYAKGWRVTRCRMLKWWKG